MKFIYGRERRLPKILAACSKDKAKPGLTHPYFNAELGEIQASDSYIAVRLPVEPEKGDASGWLVVDKVKEAIASRAASLSAKKSAHAKLTGKFPNLQSLWPTEEQIDNGFRIGFSPELLKSMIAAIDALGSGGSYTVGELIFPAYSEPRAPHALRPMLFRVRGGDLRTDGPDGSVEQPEALLMPIRLGDASPAGAPGFNEDDIGESTITTKSTKSTKSTTSKEENVKLTKAQKAQIPYADVLEDKLTAGQKAARTKALKALGLNGNGSNGNGKAKKQDLAAALKGAVKATKAKQAAQPKEPKARAAKTSRPALKRATPNARKKPTWSPEVLAERARKAAETRRKNLAAAA